MGLPNGQPPGRRLGYVWTKCKHCGKEGWVRHDFNAPADPEDVDTCDDCMTQIVIDALEDLDAPA